MNDMSAELKQLYNRRKIAFLEDLQTKRDQSRVNVYMYGSFESILWETNL